MNSRAAIYFCSILAIALVVGAYVIVGGPLSSESIPQQTPSPEPSPSETLAIDNNFVGICAHSLSEAEAQLIRDTGVAWVRIDISPDFPLAAANSKAKGLKVLGILGSWMFDKNSNITLGEWEGNVTWYVSNCANLTDAWELWNEPASSMYPLLDLNVSYSENMTKVVEFYLSMAQTAFPIIRQHDPSAKIVLFGGLNLWSGGATNLELDKDFAEKLVGMGILQYGDVVSVHAYPWSLNVEDKVWQSYSDSLGFYRGLFGSKEIWVTETGLPAEAGEVVQAKYMIDSLRFFDGKISRFFWYSLLDNKWEQEQQQSFGLFSDGQTRLAYQTLKDHLHTPS